MPSPNPELELAEAFVRETNRALFLMGRAGTGKTTFLRRLHQTCPKRMVVTAPTGIAAINAGGVTLHSFFQLPFGPFIPGTDASQHPYRFSRQKRLLIKSLDLLVVDEVSMVRADQLDAVDQILRRLRRRQSPFGGVQLLLIGDLHQLAPVVRDDEWRLLQSHYASAYFFSSNALSRTELVTIELQRVYRQTDQRFIDLLDAVRDGRLDSGGLARLNTRLRNDTASETHAGYIHLCTHNRRADTINAKRLAALTGEARSFEAEVTGDFPPHAYPTFATLGLKLGAQVMFVRNDPSSAKRYFNGKLGEVVGFNDDHIEVRCAEEGSPIAVERVAWENVQYGIDADTAAITATVTGTFCQYPLKLAWAITIHKSQGLTFDKVIIDAEAAFAHGQVYVALSRCRSLEGLVLSTPLSKEAITTDRGVQQFLKDCRQQAPTRQQLERAASAYHQDLLLECFDFRELGEHLRRLDDLVRRHAAALHISGARPEEITDCCQRVRTEICVVGEKFQRQLRDLFPQSGLPGEDAAVRQRLSRAADYFERTLATSPGHLLDRLIIETDNKALRRRLKRIMEDLRTTCAVKSAVMAVCGEGFSPEACSRALAQAITTAAPAPKAASQPTYTEADVGHPALFDALKAWRNTEAKAQGLPAYRILHQKTLVQIAVHLPDTLSALKRVKGIGDRLSERYGEALVAVVSRYRKTHGIETVALPDPPPQPAAASRIDTKQLSLDLFEQGRDIAQIAAERHLARATIEGHLAHWVATGRLAIDRIVAKDVRAAIEMGVHGWDRVSYKGLRDRLDRSVGYGEIKLVLAHLKWREGQNG